MTSNNGWSVVPLGEVLFHRKEFVRIDDLATYKRCRVQLHAKGVVLRDEVEGAVIKTKTQQVCRTDELLVAEIDAKVGGYGLVPQELDGAIVSSHYFLFPTNRDRLEPRFLDYFVRTPTFRDQVSARGSTNYAAIRPHHVLAYKIPLPPLSEQRRIVAKIERLAAKIDEAHGLLQLRCLEISALLKASRRILIGSELSADWVPLRETIIDIENGWSPSCLKHPASDGKWGVLKVGAVSFGKFDPGENKELPAALRSKPEYEIQPGDFLMSRANTVELVGACALVRTTPSRLLLCDKIFRFRFHEDNRLDSAYLDHTLKSPALRAQIETGATGTSPTMKNISKAKILNLRIPLPPLAEQCRIVAYLDGLQAKVDELKRLQADSAAELDALLPAILDRAFKGEL